MNAWLLVFHVVSIVAWFAALFYLPRLFVYHADATDIIGIERFKVMEHKLFYAIMLPASILTLLTGLSLLLAYGWQLYSSTFWLWAKLVCVGLLYAFQFYCWKFFNDFKHDRNKKSARFFRIFNEIPTLLLFAIVILVIIKP